jgi:hypothetical protein
VHRYILPDAAHWRWHPGYGTVPANPGVQAKAILDGTAPWGVFGQADSLFCWTAWHRQAVNMAFVRINMASKNFYKKRFTEEDSEGQRPDCFSNDGVAHTIRIQMGPGQSGRV